MSGHLPPPGSSGVNGSQFKVKAPALRMLNLIQSSKNGADKIETNGICITAILTLKVKNLSFFYIKKNLQANSCHFSRFNLPWYKLSMSSLMGSNVKFVCGVLYNGNYSGEWSLI